MAVEDVDPAVGEVGGEQEAAALGVPHRQALEDRAAHVRLRPGAVRRVAAGPRPVMSPLSLSKMKRAGTGARRTARLKPWVSLKTWPVGAPPAILTAADLGDRCAADPAAVDRGGVGAVVRHPQRRGRAEARPHALTTCAVGHRGATRDIGDQIDLRERPPRIN